MSTAARALTVVVVGEAVMWLIGVPPTLLAALRERGLAELAGIRLLGGPVEALGLGGLATACLLLTAVNARATPGCQQPTSSLPRWAL